MCSQSSFPRISIVSSLPPTHPLLIAFLISFWLSFQRIVSLWKNNYTPLSLVISALKEYFDFFHPKIHFEIIEWILCSWLDPGAKNVMRMAIHSNILAWRIPGAEEPVRLPSMELQGIRHDWATSIFTITYKHFVAEETEMPRKMSSLMKVTQTAFIKWKVYRQLMNVCRQLRLDVDLHILFS